MSSDEKPSPAGQEEDCSFLALSLAVSHWPLYLKYCLCQRKIKVLDVRGWEDIWGSLTRPVYCAEGEDPERKRESPGATLWRAVDLYLTRCCCYHKPSINILLQTWQWPPAKTVTPTLLLSGYQLVFQLQLKWLPKDSRNLQQQLPALNNSQYRQSLNSFNPHDHAMN